MAYIENLRDLNQRKGLLPPAPTVPPSAPPAAPPRNADDDTFGLDWNAGRDAWLEERRRLGQHLGNWTPAVGERMPTLATSAAPTTSAPTPPTNFGGGNVAQQQRQIQDAMNAGAPLGFDQAKWATPDHQTTKYIAGRILAAGGSIDDVLRHPMFQGWAKVGADKIKSPSGAVYDLFYDDDNATGQRRVQYTRQGGTGSAQQIAAGRAASSRLTAGSGSGVPSGRAGLPPGDPGSIQSSYSAQFSDPSTAQYEQLLMTQLQALEAQRAQQAKANKGLKGQMTDANQATDRLIAYMTGRAKELQQGPYTGTEAEILRTQLLDPIERDRQAAQKRLLEYNIGGRGFDPGSGLAIQATGDLDALYDQSRARAQGDLAYRTVTEQRSRQQEAQSLLGLIPNILRAEASGDLQFLQALDASLNAPRQQALPLSQMLYRLPSQAQADALAALGMGPTADSIFQQAMGLYGLQNQQMQQGLGYYQMLGSLLPYLMGGSGA